MEGPLSTRPTPSSFIHILQQNLASSRELASGPGDDVLVVGPRVEGLEPPAGQDRLGVPKQVLLGLVPSAHRLKSNTMDIYTFIQERTN